MTEMRGTLSSRLILVSRCLAATLALALGIGARPLVAQQVAFAANVATELDSVTQAAVTREIARARERGIPVEPLVAKVREGRLKRAAGPRIVTAVAKLAVRLDSARVGLGVESTPDELVAGADAIAAGASLSSLRALRAASSRSLAAPVGTLAQLVASGVPSHRAVEMIIALMKRNATPAQVLALGNLVEMDVASGLRPDESATFRLRGIESSMSLGTGDALLSTPAMSGNGAVPPKAASGGTSKPKRQP
jgi:hypothetical protein